MKKTFRIASFISLVVLALVLTGCAGPRIAQPNQLTAPQPIDANTGDYMCPYTTDDVLAEWVDNALKARAAGQIGGAIGAYAGAKALEQVPFVGGFLGQKIGDKIGKEIAIKAAGGRDAIQQTSDQSFASLDDMAVYLYVKHSSHEYYQDALKATFGIYPEFQRRYSLALINASRGIR